MQPQLEELESLLLDWEAGELDPPGIDRVREILRGDAAARTLFVRMQMLSSALKLEAETRITAPTARAEVAATTLPQRRAAHPAARPSLVALRFHQWIAVAAAFVICMLAGRLAYLEFAPVSVPPTEAARAASSPPAESSHEAMSHGVALVTRLVDIVWDQDQSHLEVGDALAAGRLAIDSGYVQIEFFCGATVILEGPAEFELFSAERARVISGRLRAHVPPAARGFTIDVDDMQVVDLGTEFGLAVSPAGTHVQVIDGEVELHQPAQQTRLLTAGQALLRGADGVYQAATQPHAPLVGITDLESRDQGQHTARYERWKAWSAQLRRDPRLVTYYGFDEADSWERRLTCGIDPPNGELDGAIVGAGRVTGRWSTKGALEFKRPGDRVRIQIPGEFQSLTFACWAKIDSLDRRFNSLFLTDNYNQGEPHWQILESGQLYFSVRPVERGTPGPHDRKVLSPPFWEPSMSGRWLHLATTFNVETKTVTHFLNGEILSQDRIPDEQMVFTTRIGTASIGNWSIPTQPEAQFAIRNLNGSIDEFALFSAALTADEIKAMYEHGQP